MLFMSRFRPDAEKVPEFLACLWQGDVPATLDLQRWLYVDSEPREMVLVWAGDDHAQRYVERVFGSFGSLHTERLSDATQGLAACFARDLEGFGRWLAGRGRGPDEIEAELDVRRRGLEAPSPEDAIAAARAWAAERRPAP
jgi:hypothetical protein